MKIKLAILEKDKNYLSKIVTVLSTKYADSLEVYSFTDFNIAMKTLNEIKIDVFIVSDVYEIDANAIPRHCSIAYLVNSSEIEEMNDQVAICKYQKVDFIYKQILSIYSETAGMLTGIKNDDSDCRVVGFASPCGGVGTSTLAAAYARSLAKKNISVLYLNLEKFGSSTEFFQGESQYSMSDIIFALKSKKTNISIKLESCVNQDKTGVFFYSPSKYSLDMMELDAEDIIRLLSSLKMNNKYKYIVVDLDFGISSNDIKFFNLLHLLVMVSDGQTVANSKIYRAYESINLKTKNDDVSIVSKSGLIYNKFSSKSGKIIENIELKQLGGIPRFAQATNAQVLDEISRMDVFDSILT